MTVGLSTNSIWVGVRVAEALEDVGWEVKVVSHRDMATLLAVIPEYVELMFGPQLADTGAGTITLDLDMEFWNSTLSDGRPASALLDDEDLWQCYQDGVLRFEFLGRSVDETLLQDGETRAVVISGPGAAEVLNWAKVLPKGFPNPSSSTGTNTDLTQGVGVWQFPDGTTSMTIYLALLKAAQNRGIIPWVTPTFTGTTDSAGAPWADVAVRLPDAVAFKAQSNGKYVCAESGGAANLIANRAVASTWETFDLVDTGDGWTALRSHANGKYVTTPFVAAPYPGTALLAGSTGQHVREVQARLNAVIGAGLSVNGTFDTATVNAVKRWQSRVALNPSGIIGAMEWEALFTDPMIANRSMIGPWEKFTIVTNSNGTVSIHSFRNPSWPQWASADVYTNGTMWANRRNQGPWEQFTLEHPVVPQIARVPQFGTNLLQELQTAVGQDFSQPSWIRAEWMMWPGFVLDARPVIGAHREDRVIFYEGGMLTKQRTRLRDEIANVVCVRDDIGVFSIARDNASVAQWNGREEFAQEASLDRSRRDAAAAVILGQKKDQKSSWTITVPYGLPGRKPFVDYNVGDWIGINRLQSDGTSVVEAFRVIAITVHCTTDSAEPTLELILESALDYVRAALQKELTYLIRQVVSAPNTTIGNLTGASTHTVSAAPIVSTPITASAAGFDEEGGSVRFGADTASYRLAITDRGDTRYSVAVLPGWDTRVWFTGKTSSAVTLNFSTAAPGNAEMDYRVLRY